MPAPRFSPSNLSIKHRLPLLIGALLLSVIAASTWASYRGVKASALEVGRERLQNLTQQLANSSQQSTGLLLTKTFIAANDPAIRAFLESPSPATRASAAVFLRQSTQSQEPNSLQVELWDKNRLLVLIEPEGTSVVPGDLETEFKQCARDPFKAIGTLRIVNDIVVSPALAAVKDDAENLIGYLVRWRRVSNTPEPQRLRDLLGNEATLYLGNSEGDVWTNLAKAVTKPPTDLGSTLNVTHYLRDGQSVMALGRPINGTPFFLVVEFPDRVVLSHARHFLRRVMIIDAVLLAIGIVGALMLSRSITRPLNLLTESASGISGGDYSGMVQIPRNDELGALGNAFNSMVVQVRNSQLELERKVEALQESEQRLQAVIENLSEGLVVSDLDGQLLNWNRAALEIHGFASLEEGLVKLPELANIFELSELDGSVLDIAQWPLPRIIRGERLRNLEVRIRRLDADWNRVFNYGGAIVSQKNGSSAAIVTISDITDRKRAEEDRLQLAAIVRSSEGAIIGKTLDGIITSWNKGAEKLYGYAAEEVVGRSIAILGHPDHSDEVLAILERLRRGESIVHFETERIAKDGKRISLSLTISPIRDESGVISGASTIAHDITARKRAEEELRQTNQRLEGALADLQTRTRELASMTQQLWQASKLATMGELAASVAHELNNPLTTLALHAETLLARLPDDDPKRRSVQVMEQEVERMATLVSNLLLFSRRSQPQTSTVDLVEELSNSLEFIDYHLRSHRITVVTKFASGLPNVPADRQQLRQLFLNLLSNAGDAMPDGGTLTVRAEQRTLGSGAGAVLIEFSDTGIGIAPEDLPKLWEPFFTTKPEGKGTGLGLPICRRTVEEHRGTIDIQSERGKGTTVGIILPAIENGSGRA